MHNVSRWLLFSFLFARMKWLQALLHIVAGYLM